jgi:hypothetical protein
MGVELQVGRAVLGGLVVRAAQRRVRSVCFPVLPGGTFVDHVDVGGAPKFEQAGDAVLLRLPLDVFLITRTAVLEGDLEGARRPAGRATLLVEVAAEGTALVMRCAGADLGPLGAAVPQAGQAICNAVGQVGRLDLSRILSVLDLGAPASARVELAGDAVAARFEPAGPASSRLVQNDDWGVFLDAAGMERLAMRRLQPVRDALGRFMTSLSITPQWRPNGPLPHLDVRFSGTIQVPDPLPGIDVTGTIGCDLNLTGPDVNVLRATVHWSVDIEFIPNSVVNFILGLFGNQLDPAKLLGATPAGPHTFWFDLPLPPLQLAGGARLEYANLPVFPDGMLLGGGVLGIERMNTDTIKVAVDTFGSDPVTMVFCSQGALDATPPPTGHGECSGVAVLRGIGAFCGAEIVAPGALLDPYISWPNPGSVREEAKVTADLPAEAAREIHGPVQVLVRTARGVRLIDFGFTPQPTPTDPGRLDPLIDPDSVMLVIPPIFIDDCLHERPVPETREEWLRWLEEQEEMAWHPDETQLTGPERVTEWTRHVGGERMITVQLVTVTELQPGELIQFRSRDHSVDVTAGPDGRAVLPVLYPSERAGREARLLRVNRQPLEGHLEVRSVVFQRGASLPAGLRNRLSASADGTARLTAEFADRVEVHELGRAGVRRLEDPGEPPTPEPAAASEPVATEADPVAQAARSAPGAAGPGYPAGLRGITALLPVPGFADQPVAIAELADGARLVLDLGTAGAEPRVAGTFSGPIGTLESDGDWAIAADDDQVSVFRIHRPY